MHSQTEATQPRQPDLKPTEVNRSKLNTFGAFWIRCMVKGGLAKKKKTKKHTSSCPTGLGWGLPDGYDMMRVVGSSSMGDAPTVPVHPSALTQPHPLGYSRNCMWTRFLFWRRHFSPFTPARVLLVSLEVVLVGWQKKIQTKAYCLTELEGGEVAGGCKNSLQKDVIASPLLP